MDCRCLWCAYLAMAIVCVMAGGDAMSKILAFVRDAEWLDSGKVRAYAMILALCSLATMGFYFYLATHVDYSDFLAFWGAGKIALTGDFAAVYDTARQQAVQGTTGFEDTFAFVNPPPLLFAVIPFGALPYPMAWIAWIASTFALWMWVTTRFYPHYWPLILAYPGALVAASHAQNGLLTGALLVGGVAAISSKRQWVGGALIGALVVKPHLALLTPFWLAAGGRWKAFAAAAISAIGLVLTSWAAFGTETMLAYTTSWSFSAELMQLDRPEFYLRMATLYGQLRVHIGSDLALGLNAIVSAVMVAMVWLSWRRFGGDAQASGALAIAATPLASPYLFNYDLAFLILPTLWLAIEARQAGYRPWDKAILLALYLAPFVTRAFALPLQVNLMPLASSVMVWLIWQRGKTDASVG